MSKYRITCRVSCNKTPAKAFSIPTENKMATQGGFSLHCSGDMKSRSPVVYSRFQLLFTVTFRTSL